jgi:large conductance mechanosensitive channel
LGNLPHLIDLAVGVIIGAAFGRSIDSLVKHLLMPLLGLLLPGERGYLGWKLVVSGKEVPYRLFLGEVVNFLVGSPALVLGIVKFCAASAASCSRATASPTCSRSCGPLRYSPPLPWPSA